VGTVLLVVAARLVRDPLHTTYAVVVLMDSLWDHQLAGILLVVGLERTSAEVDTAVVDTAVGMWERLAEIHCMDTFCPLC
jgi:hypothetical protein